MPIAHIHIDDISVRAADRDIAVEGTKRGLIELAKYITRVPCELSVRQLDQSEIAPYITSLPTAHISNGPDKLHITANGRILEIAGSESNRKSLSEDIASFAMGEIKGNCNHLHIEFYPGHFYLSEESIPMVFYLEKQK